MYGTKYLVDGVFDEPCLEHLAGVLLGLPLLREALHLREQPVHHIRACTQ